jgi:hypothetical protein
MDSCPPVLKQEALIREIPLGIGDGGLGEPDRPSQRVWDSSQPSHLPLIGNGQYLWFPLGLAAASPAETDGPPLGPLSAPPSAGNRSARLIAPACLRTFMIDLDGANRRVSAGRRRNEAQSALDSATTTLARPTHPHRARAIG